MSADWSYVFGAQQVMLSGPWTISLAIFFARWLIFSNIFLLGFLGSSRYKASRHAAGEAIWSAALAFALTSLIAALVGRERPFMGSDDVILLIPPPLNSSFPSGHTATATAIAFTFFYARPVVGLLSFVIAGFVAFGRIATGVHFPTDVLGGVAVGFTSFLIVRFVHRSLRRRDVVRSAKAHRHEV